jgi:hypothetical protein
MELQTTRGSTGAGLVERVEGAVKVVERKGGRRVGGAGADLLERVEGAVKIVDNVFSRLYPYR